MSQPPRSAERSRAPSPERRPQDPSADRDLLVPAPRRSAAAQVHPAAFVDPAAVLGEGVRIGPGAVVGAGVRLGPRVEVGAHAILSGNLVVEEDVRIWPSAVVGEEPQDLGYRGEETWTVIGARTRIREFATVHRGTGEGSRTVVGPDVYLMACAHVGHDCTVEEGAILANGVLLAGHVHVGAGANLSGHCLVHQFVRIGRMAMISGGSGVGRDVPPFTLLSGMEIRGLNGVGIRRAGFSREAQVELREVYRLLYRRGLSVDEASRRIAEVATTPEAREFSAFLQAESRRGYCSSATSRPTRPSIPDEA